jgi:hypothetical protein
MNFTTKAALAGILGLSSIGPALADDPCTCATAYKGDPIGSIRHVSGDVMVSQTAGFGAAKAGEGLNFGSRVVVGSKGSASVHIGDCALDVPANSSLDVSQVENNICLRVQGPGQSAGGTSSGLGLPAAIIGGGLLVGGVIAATQNDDNGVSR